MGIARGGCNWVRIWADVREGSTSVSSRGTASKLSVVRRYLDRWGSWRCLWRICKQGRAGRGSQFANKQRRCIRRTIFSFIARSSSRRAACRRSFLACSCRRTAIDSLVSFACSFFSKSCRFCAYEQIRQHLKCSSAGGSSRRAGQGTHTASLALRSLSSFFALDNVPRS